MAVVRPPRLTIAITSPTNGASVPAQPPHWLITVSGRIDANRVKTIWVTVQPGAGPAWPSVQLPDGVGSWSLTGPVPVGLVTISAFAHGDTDESEPMEIHDHDVITITATGDVVSPALTISAPVNGATFYGDGRSTRVPVDIVAEDRGSGLKAIEWSVDGSVQITETFTTRQELWSGRKELAIAATPTTNHTITIRCTDQVGNAPAERSVTVVTPDTTAPFYEIIEPKDGAIIPGTSTGADITLKGTVEDRQSGVRKVEWKLDGGGFTTILPRSGSPYWQEKVHISRPGPHTITVRFTDNVGNQKVDTIDCEVETYRPKNADDLVSALAYLKDLLWFGGNHVTTPTRPLTPLYLEQVFQQPFKKLGDDPLVEWSDQRVNQIRLCIEVLRKYLMVGPPGLVAHWRFDAGSGTSVTDSSGNDNDGTLEGATWSAGKVGAGALSFDGSDDSVSVAAQPALRNLTNNFTVAFWARPQSPHEIDVESTTGNSGERGQRYVIGPQQGGIAYGSPDHAGVGISVGTNGVSVYEHTHFYLPALLVYPVALSDWTHIAVVYENNRPHLYINGIPVKDGLQSPKQFVHVCPQALGRHLHEDNAVRSYGAFHGELDDVRIYDRPLSVAEITEVRALTASDMETVWVEDALPAGAIVNGNEAWNWVSSNPTPFSGTLAHQSSVTSGTHQHFFSDAQDTLPVRRGDWLFAYVYLDPVNPPTEIMLQWHDGTSWEHRAYWGANRIDGGVDGTVSRRAMGPLPPVGQWVRLEVPARLVGLVGHTLKGMAFTLYDGQATWDRAGKAHGHATSAFALLRQAESRYCQAAYEAVLTRLGTSYEELRLVRGADRETRRALAARLGIDLQPGAPDQLEQLRLQPQDLTETKLEALFGLLSTTRDPWQTQGEPQLLTWQLEHLNTVWKQQDHPEPPPKEPGPPIIDPDLLGTADLASPVVGNTAFDLWQTRAIQVDDWLRQLRTHREAEATALGGFDRIVAETLGPVGHWKFDEGSGASAADTSGNGIDGTLQGPIWSQGKVGTGALAFDGVDDYVQIGPAAQLVLTNAGAMAAWIHPVGPGSPGNGGSIVNKASEYGVARFPNGTIQWAFANSDPGWTWMNTQVVAPEKQWTHIAVVYASGSVHTYRNGQWVHTYAGAGVIGDVNTALNDCRIGGDQSTARHFQGFLDDVRIYNRALSAGEVVTLWRFTGQQF